MSKPLQHEDRLQLATQALSFGQITSIRKAAAAFDVPYATLRGRVVGRVSRQQSQITSRKLQPTEEAALIQWIESMDDRGMSPTIGYIRQMADLLLRERGSLVLLDASVTAVADEHNTVGEKWVRRFLDRQPGLKSKYSRKYDYQRALCEDPKVVLAWFQRVQKTIESNGILDCDIYNFDETGFQMGVASTAKVVTRSDRRRRPVVVQPGNREWSTVIECINARGWALDPMIIFEGKVHISTWYEDSPLPKTWRIAVSENGWTTDELTLEWLREVFEPQTRSRTVGRYRLLILDGHGSHMTPEFDKFCKENSILIECMPPHSSHLHQALDVGCFSVLKRIYGDLVKAKMTLGVHHIDKPTFLELFFEAHRKTFSSKNIKSGFAATGLVPFNPDRVLTRLQVKVRTPSPAPVPAPDQPGATLPLKTPSNISELDHLQRQREDGASPTDRTVQKIIKGCKMAMHNAVLLHDENSRLRAENTRQKRKRARRRAFLQTGGSMTIGQGISSTVARQDAQRSQERRVEAEGGGATIAEAVIPTARKRAPGKCSVCGSTEHNARGCPCK
jgi:DDE superfamily endonuclease/Tc5 transposase DNA-binding domain/helix-turn-helix, Psq domain